MKKLENKTIYKCDYCDRISLSAGGMSSHEKNCKKNPARLTPCSSCEFLERTDEEREHTDEDCDHCYYQLYGGDCRYSNCQRKFRETTFTCKKNGNKMYYERKVYRMPRHKRDAIILKCDSPMPQKCDMYKEQRFESYETLDSKR